MLSVGYDMMANMVPHSQKLARYSPSYRPSTDLLAFFVICCFDMNRRPDGRQLPTMHVQRVVHQMSSSSAEYWLRYSIGSVVDMWSDLGLADLWCVCLDKLAR